MERRPLHLTWRRLGGGEAPAAVEAMTLHAPADAWHYGDVSGAVDPAAASQWVVTTLEPLASTVGVFLMNGRGDALTQEAVLSPDGRGPRLLAFEHAPAAGQAFLLVRNHGAEGAAGAVRLWALELADAAPAQAQAFMASAGPSLVVEPGRYAGAAASPDERLIPVSLGNNCETKFQISRILHERSSGRPAGAAFRLKMLPPDRGKDVFDWNFFDWRGTPFSALREILRRRFEGIFEQDDLELKNKDVVHRRFGTTHMHEFERWGTEVFSFTEATVAEDYHLARTKLEGLIERFETLLTRPGPFLYVHACEHVPVDWAVADVLDRLSERSQEHRFRLLIIGHREEDRDLSAFADIVDKAYRPVDWSKPDGRVWEGDDVSWNGALAPYRLAFPDGRPAEVAAVAPGP